MKPGCGGFGIRNFLTLFLSIEVTKALDLKVQAEQAGDQVALRRAHRTVEALTAQMDDSNPILTQIAEAMTAEGNALEKGDAAEAARWTAEKAKGQQKLQDVSAKYKDELKRIREDQPN